MRRVDIADYNLTPDVAIVDTDLSGSLTCKLVSHTGMNDIPATLAAYGVDEKLFKDNLERMAEGAVEDSCTGTNPRDSNNEKMRQLFELAYYGK
ncbi:hypothetical protein [Pseudodesulfovibrio sp.]|uniref:hypothetical protein n=1 Tax=unclassified Pseudodesulfovibrio TaxID=2661612 RepID=UPI003B002042